MVFGDLEEKVAKYKVCQLANSLLARQAHTDVEFARVAFVS